MLSLHLILRPPVDRLQSGDQRPSPLGKRVLNGRRDRIVLRSYDETVLLQLPQTLGEHRGRDPHNFPLKLPVAERLVIRIRDIPQDGKLPFLPGQPTAFPTIILAAGFIVRTVSPSSYIVSASISRSSFQIIP